MGDGRLALRPGQRVEAALPPPEAVHDGDVAGAENRKRQEEGEEEVGEDEEATLQGVVVVDALHVDALAQAEEAAVGGVQGNGGVGGAEGPGADQQLAAVRLDPLAGGGQRMQRHQVPVCVFYILFDIGKMRKIIIFREASLSLPVLSPI